MTQARFTIAIPKTFRKLLAENARVNHRTLNGEINLALEQYIKREILDPKREAKNADAPGH